MAQTPGWPERFKQWIKRQMDWKRMLAALLGLMLLVFRDEVKKGIENAISLLTSKQGQIALRKFWQALGNRVQQPVWVFTLLAAIAAGTLLYVIRLRHVHRDDMRKWKRLEKESEVLAIKVTTLEVDALKHVDHLHATQIAANSARKLLTDTIHELDKLGKTFLETAHDMADSGVSDTKIIRLLEVVIRGLAAIYNGKVDAGAILTLDEAHSQHLWWLAGYNFTPGARTLDYYVGPAYYQKRSVAGAAWHTCNAEHCIVDALHGTGSHPDFIPSKRYEPGQYPYQSFIAIPLTEDYFGLDHEGREQKKLGVVCLNSPYPDTFVNDPALSREERAGAPSMPFLHAMYHILEWRA